MRKPLAYYVIYLQTLAYLKEGLFTMKLIAKSIPILLFVLMTGCAEVKPWKRGELAAEGAQLTPDALEAYAKEHTYFSKEASTGGVAVGGGGCGCN